MEKFDIQKILEHYKPDTGELSKVLFPKAKYPKQAFDRVVKGEANLDVQQVEKLASYLGVLISDLFSVDDWKGQWDNDAKCVAFVKAPYRVNLNYNGTFITVYKDEKVIHREVKATPGMQLTDFISYINKFIQ